VQLSSRTIKPSAVFALKAKVAEMKAQGKNIIEFGIGEPDFPTPIHIRDAAVEAMQKGETKYTNAAGRDELRQAIANKHVSRIPISS
jgi:aspartate aminotransferase